MRDEKSERDDDDDDDDEWWFSSINAKQRSSRVTQKTKAFFFEFCSSQKTLNPNFNNAFLFLFSGEKFRGSRHSR